MHSGGVLLFPLVLVVLISWTGVKSVRVCVFLPMEFIVFFDLSPLVLLYSFLFFGAI